MPTYWGAGAGGAYIRTVPIPSQIGITAGAASFTDGFVPDNMTPEVSGGIPPFGQDMNGALRAITQWLQWAQAGNPLPYDATFQGNIGGYPQGAIIASATTLGVRWLSIVDNNTSNPDSGGDNWITTGDGQRNDMIWNPAGVSRPGWVIANGTTIGNSGSSAGQLAAAVTLNLYTWLWTNFPQTLAPVTGGRGVSASADFNANKPIATLDMRGVGPVGADTMGSSTTTKLTGAPITSNGNQVASCAAGTIAASTTAQIEAGSTPSTLTINGAITGTFAVGQTIVGASIAAGTVIISVLSGTGGAGSTYGLNISNTVAGGETITAYNAAAPGVLLGENAHTSTVQETAPHTHVQQGSYAGNNPQLNSGGGYVINSNGVTSATGGGLAHNNVALSLTGYWYHKL